MNNPSPEHKENAEMKLLPWKSPFKYYPVPSYIADSLGRLVLDIRGWGTLTGHGEGGLKLSEIEATKIQDDFGNLVTELLNTRAAAVVAAIPEAGKELAEAKTKYHTFRKLWENANLELLQAQAENAVMREALEDDYAEMTRVPYERRNVYDRAQLDLDNAVQKNIKARSGTASRAMIEELRIKTEALIMIENLVNSDDTTSFQEIIGEAMGICRAALNPQKKEMSDEKFSYNQSR